MFNKNTDAKEVVHEYLHLFLISLRYGGNTKLYDKIIDEYRITKLSSKTLNSFKVEELLVDDLAKQLLDSGIINTDVKVKESIFNGIVEGLSNISEDLSIQDFAKLKINSLEALLSYDMKNMP